MYVRHDHILNLVKVDDTKHTEDRTVTGPRRHRARGDARCGYLESDDGDK